MLRRSSARYTLILYISDILVTVGSLYLAECLRKVLPYGKPFELPWGGVYPPIYLIAALIWTLVFAVLSTYDPKSILRVVDEIQAIILAVAFSTLTFGGALFFTYRFLSRLLVVYFVILDFCGIIIFRILWRIVFKSLDHERVPHRGVLMVGAGDVGQEVARVFSDLGWMGLQVIGYLDDNLEKQGKELQGYPVLGSLQDAENVIRENDISEVVITLPLRAHREQANLVAKLHDLNVNIKVVPDLMPLAYFRTTVEEVGGVPLVGLRDPVLDATQRTVKRIFDLTVSILGLVLFSPLLALTALIIKLDSPGPALFRQERVGENGRIFHMHKFRTMVRDADKLLPSLMEHDAEGHLLYKHRDDPRITRVGHFLRRSSIDELPQLFNVLKGEMSLVGPRPELPFVVEIYDPWQHKRFAVPPGITGWWQISGRSDKPMHLFTEDDLYYISHYSLLLDLQILWTTIGAVVRGKGAY